MNIDVTSPRSPTQELFRLRRGSLVETCWFLGFTFAFALGGLLAFSTLYNELPRTPAMALFRYLIVICGAGLIGGIVGAGAGHVAATVWQRIDLWRNPRRYETVA